MSLHSLFLTHSGANTYQWQRCWGKLTDIRYFREGKILPYADSRPTVEGHVLPRLGSPVFPALGAEEGRACELLAYWWVEVFPAVYS